jgi:hypothetical protein
VSVAASTCELRLPLERRVVAVRAHVPLFPHPPPTPPLRTPLPTLLTHAPARDNCRRAPSSSALSCRSCCCSRAVHVDVVVVVVASQGTGAGVWSCCAVRQWRTARMQWCVHVVFVTRHIHRCARHTHPWASLSVSLFVPSESAPACVDVVTGKPACCTAECHVLGSGPPNATLVDSTDLSSGVQLLFSGACEGARQGRVCAKVTGAATLPVHPSVTCCRHSCALSLARVRRAAQRQGPVLVCVEPCDWGTVSPHRHIHPAVRSDGGWSRGGVGDPEQNERLQVAPRAVVCDCWMLQAADCGIDVFSCSYNLIFATNAVCTSPSPTPSPSTSTSTSARPSPPRSQCSAEVLYRVVCPPSLTPSLAVAFPPFKCTWRASHAATAVAVAVDCTSSAA